MKPIRVVLVDERASVRQGLRMRLELEPDLEVVGEAADGETALAVCHATWPDVVVLEHELRVVSGVEVARRLAEMGCKAAIVMLTIYDNPLLRYEARQAGARALVAKQVPSEALIAAIRGAIEEPDGATGRPGDRGMKARAPGASEKPDEGGANEQV